MSILYIYILYEYIYIIWIHAYNIYYNYYSKFIEIGVTGDFDFEEIQQK